MLDSPLINDDIISKAHRDFEGALKCSGYNNKHISKMKLYSEATGYIEDGALNVPFSYDVGNDVIKFNAKAKFFDCYDLNYVQAHELSHRMDVLEYNVLSSEGFKQAVKTCREKVLNRKEEIQSWFGENGKYRNSFAISDIISALSLNEIEVPVAHDDEYLSDEKNVVLEVFADISSIDVLDDSAKIEFDDLLKEIFNEYRRVIE